ncbi:sigma 54-interacting transcriptional regulator [Roseibium aquae]|nr:sigma 54-interacting transcriptional regulator [Roseibium aquae]
MSNHDETDLVPRLASDTPASDMSPCPGDLLAQTVSLMPKATFVVDPGRDRIEAANEGACRLFGYDRLKGRSFTGLHPGCEPHIAVFAEEAIHRGTAWTRRLEGRARTGNSLALEYVCKPVAAADRTLLVLTATDLVEQSRRDIETDTTSAHRSGIMEWHRLQQFFHEMARLNDLILTAAGDGIYGVDATGKTTFVNPAAERMLGWSAADLIGRDMHSAIHHKHADGSVYPAEKCPIYNSFHYARINRVDDETFWRKDGKPVRVEYTSTPIIDGDAVLGAVILFRDIAQRKEQERQLTEALAEVDRLRSRLEMENAYLQEEIRAQRNHREIIGSSDAIADTIRQIELVAPTEANVLIIGESGTGKELVAQAIHDDSARRERPLIRVNCAAIPRELFESEFFGHVRGAFTSALRDRVGRFELADGGTLFLDEVGEIPMELQGKLLRVLQDKSYERVGEAKTRKTNVRIIAATNRDLQSEVEAGRFREDLYFRLNVFPIFLKPLRDRRDDIPPLAEHFLNLCCRRLGIAKPALSRANVVDLMAYEWPGNARELENVIERAAILSRGGRLSFELPIHPQRLALTGDMAGAPAIETDAQMREREVANLKAAVEAAGGRISGPGGAAELLDMKPTTLYSRLRRLGLQE